jgi:NADH-quinone oxidoreductase subunit C
MACCSCKPKFVAKTPLRGKHAVRNSHFMSHSIDSLEAALKSVLAERIARLVQSRGELTLTVTAAYQSEVALLLRDHPELQFEQLIDLCGVDYSSYKNTNNAKDEARFCVVSHLLSVKHNCRLRLKVFCADADMPVVDSLTSVWSSANWFEREAFDLYGIIFTGHVDLRRILTDYGFIGHPFRKDFPTSGHVEMRYDAEQKRVIYQPVSIELREITPRIVREDNYGGLH